MGTKITHVRVFLSSPPPAGDMALLAGSYLGLFFLVKSSPNGENAQEIREVLDLHNRDVRERGGLPWGPRMREREGVA